MMFGVYVFSLKELPSFSAVWVLTYYGIAALVADLL
jgi:hypothetical protein